MNNVIMGFGAQRIPYTPRQTAFLKRQYAKDLTADEFNLWLEEGVARGIQLMLGHFLPMLFSKNDPVKRKLQFIETIDSMRARAEETNDYRPDDEEPVISANKALKSDANPKGLISVTVSVFKYRHGEWHKAVGKALWDEYAPISGGRLSNKGMWHSMPAHMLTLAAERQALNKAFPKLFAGTYTPGEMEKAKIIDISPAEYAEQGEHQEMLKRQQGSQMALLTFHPEEGMTSVPWDGIKDRLLEHVEKLQTPSEIFHFRENNLRTLNAFWERNKGDALVVKQAMENRARQRDQGARGQQA